MTGDQQRAYADQLRQKQAALMAQIGSMGGAQLAGLTNATNALVVEISANQAAAIAQLPGVAQVLPVGQYKLDLSTTVPYIGATALQGLGVNGTGVTVAVLDSGVDFMHYDLGGTGVLADYTTCYAQNAVAPSGLCASYFGPAAPKVIGGHDFVGENWTGAAPNTVLQPDPNPIARAVTGGHGTNVSDIILGRLGVAPGAKTYAYKVCSAVSSSCSGVAILQGFDRALDPNADGDLSDAVDVINLSLGASYGQRENSSVQAANNASLVGSVVVVSAGNSANRPFITGSPSTATSAISVAQTQVPTATGVPLIINPPATIARTIVNTATLPWALVGAGFSGNVRSTAASPASPPGNDGCNGVSLPPLAGFVALIRRGTCAIGEKVTNATLAGAVGVLIDNNAGGDPPSFAQGGTGPFGPTLILSLADGNLIRSRLAAETINVSTGAPVSAAGSLVTTSSRGPNMQLGMIKPDIGAPGASLSADVGTGTGRSVFGGTSGAAPMVAGAAAL
ncbi:MAG: S8 family serine peptidase, partial [Aquabacterium sp.]